MAKKSSLFKTLATIITTTALTLSVATGLVIGHAVRNFNNAAQQQDKEKRVVETIEKTNSYGLIDEYTITYTDGSKSTFIVANSNGEFGVNSFPSSDGYIPDIKVGENGNFIVDGVDTGIAVQQVNPQDPRSIVSIDKTETNGLIDTYTITYTDGTTSTFIVVNGAEGPQGIQGMPGENGVTPTVAINEEGYWVINGEVTTFKAQGKDGTSLITGHGQPAPNEGSVGDTYFDVDSGNIYVKNETGWGQPIGNNQGASVLVGNGEPTPAEGKVGDSYIDASTGNIYVKGENGWSQPVGSTQGSSFLTGAGAPDNSKGKVGDSYLDTTTGLIYTKDENGWGTSIGSMMGPQGPQGPAGSGLLTGSGEPNPNLGNDNDSYIDTTTWNYYVKENGAWVFKGNLAGASGASGTTPHIGDNGNWWIGNTDTGVAANGTSGASMTTGHGNPNGDNSDPNNPIAAKEGNVGDTYIDLDTGTVYVKDENGWQADPNGAAGLHGTTPHIGDNGNWWIGDTDTGVSATGSQGPAGSSIYTGSSAPAQGLGSNNDSYIDTSTWNYYVKENGEWVLKGNIQGGQGPAGNSISITSCVKTSENGLVDTYTITFSNGDTATFEVVNGAAGQAGANGSDGHTPVITIGTNGNWFVDGVDTGTSAKGPQGETGADGNGIGSIIITNATVTETTYRIVFTNGSYYDYTVANGINGQDGADGTCMRTGETDPANDLGRDGDSYINTVTWDYFVKEAGAWVFKGNIRGASGAAGAQGAAGQNGVSVSSVNKTGSNGLVDTYTITYSDGSSTTFEVTNGAAGAQGAAGQNGNTILVGIGAPTGATGGVDGDSYIDTATWNYYLKVSGNWELQGSIQGVAGQNGRGIASITKTGPAADGLTYTYTITYTDGSEPYAFTVTNGKNGTAVLTGVDNPTTEGVDGDSYINTTSWDYFVKENGSWVKKGNIKGVSIVSVIRTDGDGSAGTVDTYTITYSNGTTSTFTVTNGANGTDGKTLLTGTGTPNSALGTVGDSYIDVASWTLYVKTAEDTWTSKGSFNGADGTSVTITDISTSGTGEPGTVDTYTVTFSDGNSLAITVYNGTNGKSLLTGAIDPTTEGVDGDSYINTSTWEYFIKESGVWTSKGIIKGNDGTSVTTGAGAPDNNDGIDGDSYIDLTTWTFYVKESGTWVEHGNIHNELDKYDVYFNLGYDSDSDGIDDTYTTVADVEHGHNINNDKPADPTRDGWIFQGWYTASGTKWDFGKDVITGDTVLYARWAKFKVENGVLTECTATGDVVIPEFFDGQLITAIGDNVFKDNTGITSITIPYTVTSIGNSAFEGCTGLTSIIIPHNVKTIGNDAFKGCSNMAYIYFESVNSTSVSALRTPTTRSTGGLESIGDGAFSGCTSLKALAIPNSVTSIGDNAFEGCIALESLAIPYIPNDTGTSITATWSTGHGEPDDSYNGSTVYLDEDTYKVWVRTNPSDPWYVAFDMWSPSSVKFAISDGVPNNADHVDEEGYINRLNGDVYAWTGSSYALYFNFMTYQPFGISDIFASLPSTHHSIGALFGVDNDAIPASLTTIVLNGNNAIPENALNGCSHIENIVVSGKPASIGAGAFQGCASLKSITLPYIGGFAYDPNTALTYSYGHGEPAADYNASNVYLDIDSTNVWQCINGTWVEKINWASITSNSVYVDAGAPTFVPSDNDDMYIDYLTGDMYGYDGTSWSVQMKITELDQWSLLDSPTGTNTAFIGYVFGASDYNSQASYVPTSLKTIILTGANGENGDEISAYAFGGLTSVETIVLPNNIKQIKQYAFAAVEMDSFVIPDSVTNIFENAFYHARIRELTIPFVGMGRTQGQQNLGALFGNYHKFIETITLTGGNGVDGNIISYSAFEGCKALTTINLPNNIVRIEDNAFRYCESLTSIVIPYGVTYIGQYAFGSCTSLSYVGLPSTLTTLESFAFDSCSSLEYIVLPEGLRTIGWYAFTHSGLKNIVIPSSVTRIGADSFSYCDNLTSVLVLDGVDKIVESGAFRTCQNLKYVKFECAISSFGYAGGEWLLSYWNPFFDCNNLEYVDLGRDLLAPSDEADAGLTPFYEFKNNASGEITGVFEGFTHLKTVILPNTITNISEKTFKGCSSLTAITLPSELTNIGANAFEGCSNLAYVYFNEKLQTIGIKAFAYCSSLKAISVPNSVTTIGKGAFEVSKAWTKYDNLKSSYSSNATSIVVDVFANRTTTGTDGDIFVCTDLDHFGHIYVRNGTGNDWVLKDTIHYSFASGTTNPAAASANSNNLNVVFINTNTGEMLINSNSKLESISLPFIGKDNGSDNSYNNIGYIFGTTIYAENHTYVPYSLKTVIINNASNIVSNAFYKCFNIETIVINGTASSVGLKAFNECRSLKNISLPSTISTINLRAFSYCSSLVNLVLPNSVNTLGDYAVSNCQSLETVYLPEGLTTIGKECFFNDISLKSVYLPDSVTSVGICVFQECSALTSVRFSNNMDTISQQMFYKCTSLESIVIPGNIQRIDLNAFNGCTSLKYAFFNEGIKVIHEYAFQDCTSLTSIALPNSIKDLGRGVFHGCTSLESISLPFAGASYSWMGDVLTDDNIEIGGKPDNSVGNDNDLLVDTTNDKIFRKIDGKWYSQLQFVHIGESTPGDITYGHGAPTPASGNSFYVDVDNYDFYEIDSTDPNVWHKIGNLNILFAKFAYIFVSPNGNATFDTFNNDTLSNLKTVVITKGSYNQTYDRYFIQEDSFMGCADIEHISLPKDVYTIDDNAFKGCTSLKIVTFADNTILDNIGAHAFDGCTNLKSINIPTGLTQIGDYAFKDCDAFTTLVIPDTITSIGLGAFQGWEHLENIVLPFTGQKRDCRYDDEMHFSYIFGAERYYESSTYMPNSLKTVVVTVGTHFTGNDSTLENEFDVYGLGSFNEYRIPTYAFYECNKLVSISIPSSIKTIGAEAFYKCSSLVNINFGNDSQLVRILPDAFSYCDSIESIIIPKNVETIYYGAFSRCTGLKAFTYEEGSRIEKLGVNCFYNCTSLLYYIEPESCVNNSVAYEGPIFTGTQSSLVALTIKSLEGACYISGNDVNNPFPFSLAEDRDPVSSDYTSYYYYNYDFVFLNTNTYDYFVWFGDATTGSFVKIGNLKFNSDSNIYTAESDGNGGYDMPTGTFKNGDVCYSYYDNYYNISIEDAYYWIYFDGSWGNPHCMNVKTVGYLFGNKDNSTVPSSLKTVVISGQAGDYTYSFKNCTSIETIVIPEGTSFIGNYAFANSASLIAINMPSTLKHIGAHAFDGCASLICAPLNDGLLTIDDYAFRGCAALETVSDSNSVTVIGDYAFADCTSLKNFNFSTSLKSIGDYAFLNVGSSLVADEIRYGHGNPILTPESKNGNFYIDVNTGDFYTKQNGVWRKGKLTITIIDYWPDDDAGHDGDYCATIINQYNTFLQLHDGNGWKDTNIYINHGHGAPTVAPLENGDIYYDEDTEDLYFASNGTWVKGKITPFTVGNEDTYSHTYNNDYYIDLGYSTDTDNGYTCLTWDGGYCWYIRILAGHGAPGAQEGDKYIDVDSGKIFTLQSNNWVLTGNATIGHGVPPIVGDGSYYYDSNSGLLYYSGGDARFTSVVIPNGVKHIGLGAFQGWNTLENIVLPFTGSDYEAADPSDPTHFGHIFGAVDYNSNNAYVPASLKNVVVTKGTYISISGMYILNSNTFAGCSHIKSISVPDSVSVILDRAFKDCSSLTNVTFGNNPTVEFFSDYVFSGCSSLETFVVPKSVQSFGMYTFENCTSLKYVAFADGSAFAGMNDGAFAGCSNLVAISLPDTTMFIGSYAFKNCTSLETVVIPSSVTDMYDAIFNGCTSLKTISVPYLPFTPAYRTETENRDPVGSDDAQDDNWIWINTNTGDVWYRVGGDWYKSFNIKKDPSDTIRATPSGSSAPSNPNEGDIWVRRGAYNDEFLYSRYTSGSWTEPIRLNIRFLDSLFEEYVTDNSDVPDSLKTVIISNGEHANYTFSFTDCGYLETVVLPDDTTIIGHSAFKDCWSLKYSNFEDITSLEFIGDYAFRNTSIEYVDARDLSHIGEFAFEACWNLKEVYLEDIGSIGDEAFRSCEQMSYATLFNVGTIGEHAFRDNYRLTNLIIYNSLGGAGTSIGSNAFGECYTLTRVNLSNIISMGTSAFANCSALTYIDLTGVNGAISNWAFADCHSLTTVIIGNNVTSIGERAFYRCYSLNYLSIGTGVTSIGGSAFSDCRSLSTIEFNSVSEITFGQNVFFECHSITKVVYASTSSNWTSNFYNKLQALDKSYFSGVTIKCTNGTIVQA